MINLIRYADDFVILHKEHSVVLRCSEIIAEWLKDMGLELKSSKTRTTHTLHNVGIEKAGFDFLGFHIQQFNVGKYASGKNGQKELLGFKTLIKPSKKSISKHYKEVVKIIETSKTCQTGKLISRLNPVIKGWCNYYSTQVSKEVFSKLDSLIKWKLWKWVTRRHRNKGKKWIKSKYFQSECYYNKKENKFVISNHFRYAAH